jgi:hypothetical protein
MIVRLNPKTNRITLERVKVDHKAELKRHMASLPRTTLRLSDDHLFGEHR